LIQSVLSQLNFSFYRPQPIRADFSGGQITSDAGLLPLRAFDQRHGFTWALAQHLRDPRQDGRVRHSCLSLVRQRVLCLAKIVTELYRPIKWLRHRCLPS